MFKLKPGNVFEKLNKMNRKQAYTLGAVVVVCLIALITLASFMGDADDASFDDFNARGYDLAQMPFVNDEAEQYLLASKYPDMQNNGSTALYSAAEREEREAEDAEAEEEEYYEEEEEPVSSDNSYDRGSSSYSGSSRRGGYSGRGGSRGGGSTQVGQLGSASVGRAHGSGVGGSWGAPRGDFSPYKSQDKGKERNAVTELRNKDARKALYQYARGSRAAAGLKEGKIANAKKALMGGTITGGEAFTDNGVDLSKAGGLNLDTNAPSSSADLSNLDQKVNDAAQDAKDKDDKDKEDMKEKLLEQLYSGLLDIGLDFLGNIASSSANLLVQDMQANIAGHQAAKDAGEAAIGDMMNVPNVDELTGEQRQKFQDMLPKGKTLDDFKGKTGYEVLAECYGEKKTTTVKNPLYKSADSETSVAERTDEMMGAMNITGRTDKQMDMSQFAPEIEQTTYHVTPKDVRKGMTNKQFKAMPEVREARAIAREEAYGRYGWTSEKNNDWKNTRPVELRDSWEFDGYKKVGNQTYLREKKTGNLIPVTEKQFKSLSFDGSYKYKEIKD